MRNIISIYKERILTEFGIKNCFFINMIDKYNYICKSKDLVI